MAGRYPSSSKDDGDVSQMDSELKLDIRNVLNRLKIGMDSGFSPDKWHNLGLVLKVPAVELKAFEVNHIKDVQRCLTEAIKYWIRNGAHEVKWEVLWEALCHSTVSHQNLGMEIRDWYKEKTWRDPRKGTRPPKKIYIQMPGRDKRLKAFECNFSDTGFCPPQKSEQPNPPKYFRILLMSNSIYDGHLKGMKSELRRYFSKLIEPHQEMFKAGYEARFGQLYWIESEENQLEKEGDVGCYTSAWPRSFSTHVTCDITKLTTAKCHPPKKDHEVWLVDPLKFEVDLPQYKGDIFIAVISDLGEHGFRLHDVYQQQKRSFNTSFDIVQPGRKYDFRIADCCACLTKTDDDKVKLIADDITRSIHRGSNGSLSMKLVGKEFHVRFFRQKRQQIYQWKGKEKEKWYLVEFDVDTFEMSDDKHETYRKEFLGDDKHESWPVEFSGGRRKEIELWSRKIFPERYSSSHPTARLYIDPEATGEVRMPHTEAKPATTWTTDELMKDFDEFVQAAYEITEFLERAPESKNQ